MHELLSSAQSCRFVLELSIIVKIKGGSVCIVYSRKEQCKISSSAVQIPCYFWYLTSAEKTAKTTGCFHFYYVFLTLLLLSYSYALIKSLRQSSVSPTFSMVFFREVILCFCMLLS